MLFRSCFIGEGDGEGVTAMLILPSSSIVMLFLFMLRESLLYKSLSDRLPPLLLSFRVGADDSCYELSGN